MSQTRIELSLDPEIIKLLRTVAIKKYGNLRSVSQLIEDLFTQSQAITVDIEAIKAERAYAIAELTKDTTTRFMQGGYQCGMSFAGEFRCERCGAEFEIGIWDIKYARYCPICDSNQIKQKTRQESDSTDSIVARINGAALDAAKAAKHKRKRGATQ